MVDLEIPVNLKYLYTISEKPFHDWGKYGSPFTAFTWIWDENFVLLHHLTNRPLLHKFQHVLYGHLAENRRLGRVIILCACTHLCIEIYLFLDYKMMVSLVHTEGSSLSNMRWYFGIWLEWPQKIHNVHYHARWLLGQVVSSELPKYEAQC